VVKNTAIILGRVYGNLKICLRSVVYVVVILYTYSWLCA